MKLSKIRTASGRTPYGECGRLMRLKNSTRFSEIGEIDRVQQLFSVSYSRAGLRDSKVTQDRPGGLSY